MVSSVIAWENYKSEHCQQDVCYSNQNKYRIWWTEKDTGRRGRRQTNAV
jgi:hypothetical protein